MNRFVIIVTLFSYLFSGCSGSKERAPDQPVERVSSDPDKKVAVPEKPIRPKIYLEQSGSMLGYDGPGVNGHLKSTIMQMINHFDHPDSTAIYIVNDSVYPYPKSYTSLIKSASIFQDKVGDRGYTDFGRIFKTIIKDLKENEIAILTTDLIYSERSSANQDADRIMTIAQNLAYLAMKNYSAEGSLFVLKMHSEYDGWYYPYNSTSRGVSYRGDRPYYLLLFAKNRTMSRFLTDPKYEQFRAFDSYPAFENQLFMGHVDPSPFYTIVKNHSSEKGTYTKDRSTGNSNVVHSINAVTPPHGKGQKLTIAVAARLPSGTLGDAYVSDIANYEVESVKDRFRIKAIRPSRYAKATHDIILEAQAVALGERRVVIRLKRRFPPRWVTDSHSGDDTNVKQQSAFAGKTFGLTPMLTGIQQAYADRTADAAYYFKLELKLNK